MRVVKEGICNLIGVVVGYRMVKENNYLIVFFYKFGIFLICKMRFIIKID